jgi:hypothetical protein
MRKYDLNRVKFYSKEDMAGRHHLAKAESILKGEMQSVYENINEVLELYNIKKYFDNKLYLKNWTQDDIDNFKKKVNEYGNVVGQFMSKINDDNFIFYYEQLLQEYIDSFWKLLNNQDIYKRVSAEKFMIVLSKEPHEIRNILTCKNLVAHYNTALRDFLKIYPKSAELLLSIYEEKKDFHKEEMYLPKSLTIQDKENIISNYLDSDDVNLNYIQLIHDSKKQKDFTISDKTRLKAKRKDKEEIEKYLKKGAITVSNMVYPFALRKKQQKSNKQIAKTLI